MRVSAKPLSTRALAFAWLAALVTVATALPAGAVADATPAPENRYSSSPGLPDGRVYEQVSPANKHGFSAGATTGGQPLYSIAAPDGDAAMYFALGPVGEADSGLGGYAVARRGPGGWASAQVLPRGGTVVPKGGGFREGGYLPAENLSRVAFVSEEGFAGNPDGSPGFYLTGAGSFASVTWLAEPTIATPTPALGGVINNLALEQALVGGSPDLSTVYFEYPGTLVTQDVPRTPFVSVKSGAYGLYEWRDGRLSATGVLLDGSLSRFGAVAASTYHQGDTVTPAAFHNQVSSDGSRAFFVSPDPVFCKESGLCGGAPQLYVRETAADGTQSTALVSRDELLPAGEDGLPASAPAGPLPVGNAGSGSARTTYVYASPDGSQAFFESVDALTAAARQAEESGAVAAGAPKEYDFDTRSGALTYLPGVTDGAGGTAVVLASAPDGSRFMFARKSVSAESLVDLDLWTRGAGGAGSVSEVSRLPGSVLAPPYFDSVRAGAGGSVFAFETTAPLPWFNNGGLAQVYRYDATAGTLACVSCPPRGVPARASALSSSDMLGPGPRATRGISEDGRRVFFATAAALVPQDTDGVSDVYEWEEGTVYLISSGAAGEGSFLLDSSASGGDVFFTTSAGLAAGDTDGGYDVYDARVPHPGDTLPPAAVPCRGSVCQGPPEVPAPLGLPASATFAGLGNAAPPRAAVVSKPRKKKKQSRGHGRHRRHTKRAVPHGARRAAAGRAVARGGRS